MQGFGSNGSSSSPVASQGPQGLQGRRGPPGPRGTQVSGRCPGSEPTMSPRCGCPPLPLCLLSEEGAGGTYPPRALQMSVKPLTLWVYMATWERVGGKGHILWVRKG